MWHEARKQEKKIRGMMVDYKRRAERRREYYEKIKQDPAQFLQVHGRPAKIHLDPAVAIAADSPATMMPWQGHADNLIDRFDVRAHLDLIPEYKPPSEPPKVSFEEEDRKTCYERYRTLVQNDFMGVNEDKFLHQIFMEERFGIFKPSCEEEKKKLMDKKAAIGYVYEDSTESPPRVINKNSDGEDEENEEEKEEDLSDLDLDVTVDVNVLTPSQCAEMNAQSIKYGMVDDDFITYLLQDKEEAEQLRVAREIEEEKAMYSGRKSRRERRALREKKLAGRKITSPPSYAARDSPTYTPMRHSASKSRSRSPPDAGKIMFITSFGDEGSDGELRAKLPDKSSLSNSKQGKSNSKGKDNSNVIGPQLPSRNGDGEKHTMNSSKNSISSDSSRSPSRLKRKDNKSYRDSHRKRKKSPSRSRSKSRSSSVSSKKASSKSKKHSNRNSSKSKSRSRSVSSSRSRSRSHNRSRNIKIKSKSRSRSRSKSRSKSRSRSKSSLPKSNTEKSESPKLPPPPVKSYYRHSLSRSNTDQSEDSEEDKSSNKSSPATSLPSTSRLQQLMGKAPPATKTKLTPQERLKRKMQLQLKKQYKADKKAQMEKTEKQLQERQDRAEELREMAIKLRQRERERRHRMRGYGYDSDSDTTWTRNPDYNSRSSDSHHSRRHDPASSGSDSSPSNKEQSPPPSTSYSKSRHSHSKTPPPRISRRSPVHDRRHVSPPNKISRRSPGRRSPRRSPHRSYRRSRSPARSSYVSRDRRSSPRRRSPSRSPSRRYSRSYRHNHSHSRSKSPVSRPYSSKPLVDY